METPATKGSERQPGEVESALVFSGTSTYPSMK